MKLSRKALIRFIVVFVTIGIASLMFFGLQWQNQVKEHSKALNSELLGNSHRLNRTTQELLNTLSRCSSEGCDLTEAIDSQINTLQQDIERFKHAASMEKTAISLVGNTLYPQLELALIRYDANGNISQLLQKILSLLPQLLNTQQNLVAVINSESQQRQQDLFYRSIFVFLIFSLIASALLVLLVTASRRQGQHSTQAHSDVTELANQLENISATDITHILNDISTPPAQRRIFANLSTMYQDVEQQKRNADLYRQLYALIGYEIRGMTNTIQGGVRLIAQEAGENGAVLARDITLATNTLSELADNYNRLISGGNSAVSGNVSFLPLMSELLVHLSAKTQHSQRHLECHLGNNLPGEIEGNPTSLFWVLFLQLSNAISAQNEPHILFHIDAESADEVEQSRIIFEITFLPSNSLNLQDIKNAEWSRIEEKSGINDEWSKAILSKVTHFESTWLKSDVTLEEQGQQPQKASMQKLRIGIDITPKSFHQAERSLENKHLMICTDSQLQIDIMSQMLSQYGATVEIIRSANDIFKSLPRINEFDGIIITDTIKGIQLKSFCKTLHSRLKKVNKTKLFLAASESSTVQDTHEFVDRVFFTPFIPHELVPNLTEAMQATEETSEQAQNTFLIVEDDKVQQFLLKKLLSKQGYEAHTVSDGAQAVDYMKEHGADIVFMDCIMPGMGGIEATKLIRQREQDLDVYHPATIIGATALTSASEHKSCIEAGMDYVISKPYKNDEIIKVIKKYMAIKKIC
ncbi:response regulator [Photobacterium rosenbergii]|uniref:ATP-binding response regulator n=1 Tax=Photobacterium rosenbergii TaxID=294936 RepID=UPI0028F73807|nr:response regulator [Photobacterium rosenbergii]